MRSGVRYFFLILCLVHCSGIFGAVALDSTLSFRRFTTLDGLPQMQTETIWQDSRGYIYIGTLSGFVKYDGISLKPYLKGRRENIVAFQEVGTELRALGFVRQWRIKGSRVVQSPIDPDGNFLLNNLNSTDLPNGYLLLEDRQEKGRVLCCLEPGGMSRVLDAPVLDAMTPDKKIFVDSSLIYVPTHEGLYIAEKGELRGISKKDDVFSLVRVEDKLFALASDGVYLVSGDSLILRLEYRFEAPDYGLSVRRNRKGQLVIADTHSIYLYDDEKVEMSKLASGFNLIRCLFIDKWDRLWLATYQGTYCFFHCDFVNYRLKDGNDIVRALAVSGNHLVLGTLNGKAISDGKVLDSLDGNFYYPGAAVIDGKAYLSGNGDIACVYGGSFKWLHLPNDSYRFVSSLDSILIIGTRNSLLAYNPADCRLDTLATEMAHPWNAVSDGMGKLWVSCNSGLYCLISFDVGNYPFVKTKNTSGSQVITAMASNSNGLLCYAIADSLFCTSGINQRWMKELSPVLSGHEIRSVHISGCKYLIAAAIDGLMVCHISDSGEASDVHWFDSTNGFTMIEPMLGPMAETENGTVYLAGVEGMTSFNPEFLLSDNQHSTIVEAPVPFWRRWWFVLLAAVLILTLIWRLSQLFHQQRTRKRMAFLEREKMQKDLQLQAVRLKAIPHFHSNVIAGIEFFVLNKSSDEASHYLKLYSDFTNKTLSEIDRPSRSIAEEVDYVRNYLELEKLRFGERLQYIISVAPGVNQEQRVPNMLLHTYCQNAVKHGISSKAGVGEIDVRIVNKTIDGTGYVLLSVSDNGVGRSEAARSGGFSTKQGLKILGQQIELYNQINRHHIIQSVTDLTDSMGMPSGTRFEVFIPEDYKC